MGPSRKITPRCRNVRSVLLWHSAAVQDARRVASDVEEADTASEGGEEGGEVYCTQEWVEEVVREGRGQEAGEDGEGV